MVGKGSHCTSFLWLLILLLTVELASALFNKGGQSVMGMLAGHVKRGDQLKTNVNDSQ
jgi:hypothetical protein